MECERQYHIGWHEKGLGNPGRPWPSDRELDVLNVLWEHGELTTREVYCRFMRESPEPDLAYNTILTHLRSLIRKGWLVRGDGREGKPSYRPSRRQNLREARVCACMWLVESLFQGDEDRAARFLLRHRRPRPPQSNAVWRTLEMLDLG